MGRGVPDDRGGQVEHHDERAEQLEREADKLEEHSEHIGGRIEDARKDWQSKQEDQSVPGAQSHEALHPDEDEGDENEETREKAPGVRDPDDSAEVGDE
jgi:hypothetical protein